MYLNLIQVAESFGVSEGVVEDWIRDEGLPCTPDRGRLLFDRAQVETWAASHGLTARAGFLAPASGALSSGLALAPMLRVGGIWRDVPVAGAAEVFGRVLAAVPGLPPPVRTLLATWLEAAEGLTWAPVGDGFALPHFRARVSLGRGAGVLALVLLAGGLPLDEWVADDVPVTRLFFFVPPSPRAHLDVLGRLSKALAKGPLREAVQQSAPDAEILAALAAADAVAAQGGEGGR